MQAGFMLVETGLCRAKDSANTAALNLIISPLGCLAFWVYGFAIGWGNWWNGPVPPGWYPSLGPGLSILNSGVGLGAAVDAGGEATGPFPHDPHRHDGRALGVEELLPLRSLGRAAVLHLRQLGVGRWLAGTGRRQLG